MITVEDNDGRYPDESPVGVRYSRSKQEERGDRAAWPWLTGWIVSQCGPDDWEICVQEPALAVMDDGSVPPPGTPDDECNFPVCFRDSSEIIAG